MPPSRTVALVDFVEPSDARKAFQSLAYRRYKHTPLFLEWAPLGLVDGKRQQQLRDAKKRKLGDRNGASTSASGSGSSGGEDKESSDSNTLFLRNLDFSCSEADVQQHLLTLGRA